MKNNNENIILNDEEKEEVEEGTTSGNVAGYNIPGAFTSSEYNNINKKLPNDYVLIKEASRLYNITPQGNNKVSIKTANNKEYIAIKIGSKWRIKVNNKHYLARSLSQIISYLIELKENKKITYHNFIVEDEENKNIISVLSENTKREIIEALKERKKFNPETKLQKIIKEEVLCFLGLSLKTLNEEITTEDELQIRSLIRDELAIIFFDLFKKRNAWNK